MGRTSRPDCVSNRNTIIMGNFAINKFGSTAHIFDGLDYPKSASGRQFRNPDEYYMWEHGWHTLEEYSKAYRSLRNLCGPSTYSECGATVAKFHSWGLVGDVAYVVGGVAGGVEKLPELNRAYNDVKEFICAIPPHLIPETRRIHSTFIIRFHDDRDPHKDYISDPHILGILRQIPVVWGLSQAEVRQPLVPYDLEKLCTEEPEFTRLNLDPHVENDFLYVRDPVTENRISLGHRVALVPDERRIKNEFLGDLPLLLGKYGIASGDSPYTGFLLDRSLATTEIEYFPAGTILGAPYFVIDFESEKEGGTLRSFYNAVLFKLKKEKVTRTGLLEAISQIANENREKNEALDELTLYKNDLEHMVQERTIQLRDTNTNLERAYSDLQSAKDREQYLDQQLRIKDVVGKSGDIAAQILHEHKNLLQPIGNMITRSRRLCDMTTNLMQSLHDQKVSKDASVSSNDLKSLEFILVNVDKSIVNADTALRSMLSTYEDFRQVYNPRETSITDVNRDLEACINLMIDRNYRSYIQVEKQFSSVSVPAAYDSMQFNRGVFLDLIKNARDAVVEQRTARGPEFKGKVLVKTESRDKMTVIRIYDNGKGVPAGFEEKMFEKMETTKQSGTGLGLYTARFILNERKCGRIYYQPSDLPEYKTQIVVELDVK